MSVKVVVEGTLPAGKANGFEDAYDAYRKAEPLSGLVATSLSKRGENPVLYRVETEWTSLNLFTERRDRIRAATAIELFQRFGVYPNFEIRA